MCDNIPGRVLFPAQNLPPANLCGVWFTVCNHPWGTPYKYAFDVRVKQYFETDCRPLTIQTKTWKFNEIIAQHIPKLLSNHGI